MFFSSLENLDRALIEDAWRTQPMGRQQPPPDWHWHSLDERELERLYCGNEEIAAQCALVELRRRHDTKLQTQAFCECGRSRELSEEALLWLDANLSKQRKMFTPEKGSWISWVRKVLHNTIIDLFRKPPLFSGSVLRDSASSDDSPINLIPSREPGPDWRSKLAEIRAAMDDCLSQLRPEERTALIRQVLEVASLREIAETAGVPAPTIGTRIHRARQKMRACLKCKGYEGGEL
jgi:RNA polymerase sigma-70 factor (ECF subfamily)